MSAMGRPEGEYRSAQHEGNPMRAAVRHPLLGVITPSNGVDSIGAA